MKSEKILEERLKSLVIPAATEGICIRVRKSGKLVCDLEVGKTYKYYDLASLTKIIFTNTAFMLSHERDLLNLNSKASVSLPWFKHRNIIVKSLLSHSAGLSWWKPIYKSLKSKFSGGLDQNELSDRWENLKSILNSEKPSRIKKSVYSDLDYFLLAFLLEKLFEKPLTNIWNELGEFFKLNDLHFNLFNQPKYPRTHYAPTEKCLWRKKLLQGEVHDENTWALGGISSHAGLFGTTKSVDEWLQQLRSSLYGKGPLDKKSVQTFLTRSVPPKVGDWALGFMMPSKESSAGRYFSKASVGHTGFTGTSVWFDPKQDFSVVILSNRIHPTRTNTMFVKKRAVIHDWCYELFY